MNARTKLIVVKREVDAKNSAVLQGKTKLKARSRGELADSVEAAGFAARRDKRDYFVYAGNSYGRLVWRIGNEREAFDPINNPTSRSILQISPDLQITILTIKREEGTKMAKEIIGRRTRKDNKKKPAQKETRTLKQIQRDLRDLMRSIEIVPSKKD